LQGFFYALFALHIVLRAKLAQQPNLFAKLFI